MAPTKDNQPVALVYHQCPLCLTKCDEQILIHKRLDDLSHLDRQSIGPSNEPCDKCKELMTMGLLIIEVDAHKTTDEKNPWRTGHIFVLRKGAAERIFAEAFNEPYPLNGCAFFSQEVVDALGLRRYTSTFIREAMKDNIS